MLGTGLDRTRGRPSAGRAREARIAGMDAMASLNTACRLRVCDGVSAYRRRTRWRTARNAGIRSAALYPSPSHPANYGAARAARARAGYHEGSREARCRENIGTVAEESCPIRRPMRRARSGSIRAPCPRALHRARGGRCAAAQVRSGKLWSVRASRGRIPSMTIDCDEECHTWDSRVANRIET